MRILSGREEQEAIERLEFAIKLAKHAKCTRSKCGAVIITPHGTLIGRGVNSPPGDLESQRRCTCDKSAYDPKVVDKTCCVHAEQRAVMDALGKNPNALLGSTLYFARLNMNDELKYSGAPYCTMCSKMVLDVGIKHFVLWYKQGVTVFDTEEYNNLSYQYDGTNRFA